MEKINEIESNYTQFNIDFNYDNITKYGFLRANPNHPSERELDERKPEALINYPELHPESIKNIISSFFEKKSPTPQRRCLKVNDLILPP